VIFLLSIALAGVLPTTPSFGTAKKRMYAIYMGPTFYCGCPYIDKTVDLAACGMADLTSTRAQRTEAEHVVPAWAFGHYRECWAEGGRSHCLKADSVFKTAHSDLYNLVPAVGQVNGDRSNYAWADLDGEPRAYGDCDFEVDRESKLAEPPPAVRGDIARTYFYMEWQYGLPIGDTERWMLLAWHQADPPDSAERSRAARIQEVQGNANPFVD
jgi:deoxyribonuclease-1